MTDINKTKEQVVTIRFSGDSGDGMQLTGNQFTNNTAIFGNDLSTLPDFPAEIRAPAGSLFGVSSFQLQFGSKEIFTPGDDLDVLVAMNPAALKVHLPDLQENGMVLVTILVDGDSISVDIKEDYTRAKVLMMSDEFRKLY